MPSLRDQLVHVLDVDPPRGLVAWVRASPLQQALNVVRGREKEALAEVQALVAEPGTAARVRRHGVALLAHLFVRTIQMPSAEDIYNARLRGVAFDPHRGLKLAMTQLLGDPDAEVAVAAAVELLQIANRDDLPALRVQLAHLLPALRERRGDAPQIQQVLLDLGGAPDMLAWLGELAALGGPLPPNLEVLLLALERDPHEAAAPDLLRLFPRLDAIRERKEPVRTTIAGAIESWDGETIQAALLLKVYARCAPIAALPAVTELLRLATPAMAAALIGELAAADLLGERGAVVAGAAAADPTLPPPAREAGLTALGDIARSGHPGRMAAIDQLQRVRADALVGARAAAILAGVAAAKS